MTALGRLRTALRRVGLDDQGEAAEAALGGLSAVQLDAVGALLRKAHRQGRAREKAVRAERRRDRRTEDHKFAAAQGRLLAAQGRRAAGDLGALADLVAFHKRMPALERLAVAGLRSGPHPYSWADIGDAVGMSRQAACERFGRQGNPDSGRADAGGRHDR